jgi:hypothetical protein
MNGSIRKIIGRCDTPDRRRLVLRVPQSALRVDTDVIGGRVTLIYIVPGIELDGDAVRDAAVTDGAAPYSGLRRSGNDQANPSAPPAF